MCKSSLSDGPGGGGPGRILNVVGFVEDEDLALERDVHTLANERLHEVVVGAKDDLGFGLELAGGVIGASAHLLADLDHVFQVPCFITFTAEITKVHLQVTKVDFAAIFLSYSRPIPISCCFPIL